MASIVFPTAGLLNTKSAPFRVTEAPVLGDRFRCLLGQNYVSVLVLSILILLGVINLNLYIIEDEQYSVKNEE